MPIDTEKTVKFYGSDTFPFGPTSRFGESRISRTLMSSAAGHPRSAKDCSCPAPGRPIDQRIHAAVECIVHLRIQIDLLG